MAYTKQNFEDGQVLKARQLEKIEDAIVNLYDTKTSIKNLYINTTDQLINWIYTDETMTERMSRDEVVQRCLNGGRLVMVMDGAIFGVMAGITMALESPDFALVIVPDTASSTGYMMFASSEYVMGD